LAGAERGNSYRLWQDATSVSIYENANNVATLRASFAAANAAGQTHSYTVLYDPATGVLQAARDGVTLGSWTDTTPLTSGAYLSLRTDGANVLFDDIPGTRHGAHGYTDSRVAAASVYPCSNPCRAST